MTCNRRLPRSKNVFVMKDHSAATYFSVGDCVRVLEPVSKAGISLKGRQGIVKESWEKCEVDPTCCCAEQVDDDLAVRVEFMGTEGDPRASGVFEYYFNEDELEEVVPIPTTDNLPFDGKSCRAFKLEQLEAHRSIATKTDTDD